MHQEKKHNRQKSPNARKKSSRVYTEPSDTRPFKSMYTEGYVTPPNYIAELIVTKRNEFFNSGRSPRKFWSQEKSKYYYKRLQWSINKFLSMFHADSIVSAVNSMKCVPKIHYHASWDNEKFKSKNKAFSDAIMKFEKTRKEKELIEEEAKDKKVATFTSKNKKNMLGEL